MIEPRACPECLRRAWLLELLGPYIERTVHDGAASPALPLLCLDDEGLATAVAPKVAEQMLARVGAIPESRLSEELEAAGCWAACRHDGLYPEQMRDVAGAPPALICRGNPAMLDGLKASEAVTVVGSRRATTYGREVARELGRDLTVEGVTVISGLAFGIDACAHRGALDQGGTIAVVGCGSDTAYPAAHRSLWRRICEQGLVLSELPPGAAPWRWTFPARNRIMAALAGMTVVVEAAARSGSLVTADLAADLGRDLGAVPGPVTSRASVGPNNLLAGGACLVRDAQDVLGAMLGAGAKRTPSPVSDLAKEAELLAALQREAEQGSERAQRELDERRADLNEAALERIQAMLGDQERTPESLDDVAEILRAAGFPVPSAIRDAEEAI